MAGSAIDRAWANQALAALLLLYVHVLGHPSAALGEIVRAKRPACVPVVLTKAEVSAVLERLSGAPKRMASLLHGAGLRWLECARLRVNDVDLKRRELIVREGKGAKDRTTVLPTRLVEPLRARLVGVRRRYEEDLRDGAGWVELPDALARSYANAGHEWPRQRVLLATRTWAHGETGQVRRHHLHETVLQRAVSVAALNDRQIRTNRFGDGSGLRICRRSMILGRLAIGIGRSGRRG